MMSTYNGGKYLREQIDSILGQRDVSVFLLVRDDGSSDDTKSIVREYMASRPNVELVEGKNVGAANSFLELMKVAHEKTAVYDYFAFSDQDDYWLPGKIAEAIKKIKDQPQDGPVLYFSNLYLTRDGDDNKYLLYEKPLPLSKSHLMVENFAAGCTIVLNALALIKFLEIPTENVQMHDKRLIHMCLFLGKIVYDSNAYIYYRQHSDNVIGANFFLKQRLNSKLKSLMNFWRQHGREEEAKEVLASYSKYMSTEDRKMVTIVAGYRKKIWYRLLLLISPGEYDFNMRRRRDNFWFKIRVVLGAV